MKRHSSNVSMRWRRARRPARSVDITMRLEPAPDLGVVSDAGRARRMSLGRAMDLGLVSEEGYLTALGFEFWRRAG